MGIAVIGAGGWGTALANLLAGKGLKPVLWCLEPELAEQIKNQRENVEMPITEQIYLLIYAGNTPKMAIAGLRGRKLKNELWQ